MSRKRRASPGACTRKNPERSLVYPLVAGNSRLSISAVVATYQAEEWIGEALDSILGQTSPPDEVVVVDDGSTDGSADILAGYGSAIRVVRQDNSGYPTAMNRAIREAKSDFVAPCGADDIWEPRKLEWQRQAIAAHPDVGVLFGHAVFFGRVTGDHVRPRGTGLLDQATLAEDLFRVNTINTPSTVIRHGLFDRLGWFPERFLADDYDFFFRCLRAGVQFYYEPRTLVRYRRHDTNISDDHDEVRQAMMLVRSRNLECIRDRRIKCDVMAPELIRIARRLVDGGHPREARQVFRRALRYAPGNPAMVTVAALVWVGLLTLPRGPREAVGARLVATSRAVDALRRRPVRQ